MSAAPLLRGGIAGLIAFAFAGLVSGWVLGGVGLSDDAVTALGFLALGLVGAAAGWAGAWQSGLHGRARVAAAAIGPLAGVALLSRPDLSAASALGLLVVLAGAVAGERALSARR